MLTESLQSNGLVRVRIWVKKCTLSLLHTTAAAAAATAAALQLGLGNFAHEQPRTDRDGGAGYTMCPLPCPSLLSALTSHARELEAVFPVLEGKLFLRQHTAEFTS